MWGFMVFSLVLLSYIFTPSLQSPQNSLFTWPTNEAKEDLNNKQQARTSYMDESKFNVGHSVQLPVKENLELMSPKPDDLSSSGKSIDTLFQV